MPVPADQDPTDNVVRLNFTARPMPKGPHAMAPFLLEARADGWKMHTGGRTLDAAELASAADLLRDIARSLTDMARESAGQPAQPCIAEFVLYDTGGIDHWVADGADRTRLRLGLRTAISTIRDP